MIQIFATYEYSSYLELAISAMVDKGIPKEHIFAVPLSNRKSERMLFDSLHNSDGVSLINKGAAIATASSVILASIGFTLTWGPIYWGLIGACGGFLLGVLIDLFLLKVVQKKKKLVSNSKKMEVILIVECEESQADTLEEILWNHLALGVARVQTE
jgi:hypothetical protein